MRRALGGDDGPDDAIENVNDWPDPLRTRRRRLDPDAIQESLGGPPPAVHRGPDDRGPIRTRRDVSTKNSTSCSTGSTMARGSRSSTSRAFAIPGIPGIGSGSRGSRGSTWATIPARPTTIPKVKIIRSLFNGSRGPLLRKATALDWAGDPIEVEGRFRLGHGEQSYAQMLDHFKDYNDIVGDHPLNLGATNLALNAYMLTHEERYKNWVLDYVGAWRQRMVDNGGIIPTNIGLDGKIGGACGGKWYGGVYGWGFTVIDPVTQRHVNRNYHHVAINGFGNAFLLTGDDRFLDAWRKQIDAVNSHAKVEGGRALYPHMHGDQGWYDYRPEPYRAGALELYYWSMKEPDRRRVPDSDWLAFLEGRNPAYPETALRGDFAVDPPQGRGDAARPDHSRYAAGG